MFTALFSETDNLKNRLAKLGKMYGTFNIDKCSDKLYSLIPLQMRSRCKKNTILHYITFTNE